MGMPVLRRPKQWKILHKLRRRKACSQLRLYKLRVEALGGTRYAEILPGVRQTASVNAELLQIISEDSEIERLYKHRNPIRFFHISDAPTRSLGMTFSDGSTMEKEAILGDRALNYLYVLADRYYKAAEGSADTPPDTATS